MKTKKMMMTKKEMLKKHVSMMGKGGPKAPTPFEMIGGGLKNLRDKVQSGITKGITNFVGDTQAGKILKDGLKNQKKGILQKALDPMLDPVNMIQKQPLKKIPKMPKKVPNVVKPALDTMLDPVNYISKKK